jgi:GT2 family glycosyltransferase
MDVSIIIVNYNTKELVSNCIKSIIEHTLNVEYEIILVDNNSTDGSKDIFLKDNRITYIQNNDNFGFGVANNIGVQSSKGKYLFFLNSDTILLNNAVGILFDFAENHPELPIAVLGGLLMDENMNETHSFGNFPSMFSKILEAMRLRNKSGISQSQSEKLSQNGFLEVDYITGADMLIKREIFDKVKGFDPNFFMYYEETDMQKQLKMLGLNNYIVDGLLILHFEGMSQKKTYNNHKRIVLDQSMLLYFRKYKSHFVVAIFKFIYFIVRFPTIFFHGYTWREKKIYFKSLLKA